MIIPKEEFIGAVNAIIQPLAYRLSPSNLLIAGVPQGQELLLDEIQILNNGDGDANDVSRLYHFLDATITSISSPSNIAPNKNTVLNDLQKLFTYVAIQNTNIIQDQTNQGFLTTNNLKTSFQDIPAIVLADNLASGAVQGSATLGEESTIAPNSIGALDIAPGILEGSKDGVIPGNFAKNSVSNYELAINSVQGSPGPGRAGNIMENAIGPYELGLGVITGSKNNFAPGNIHKATIGLYELGVVAIVTDTGTYNTHPCTGTTLVGWKNFGDTINILEYNTVGLICALTCPGANPPDLIGCINALVTPTTIFSELFPEPS